MKEIPKINDPPRKNTSASLRIGLVALVVGIGLILIPSYPGTGYLHFLSGLGFGIAIPTLIVGLTQRRKDRAG